MVLGQNVMSVIHSEILTAVQTAPGIGPGQVADMLGQDKSYVRRAMKSMAAKGAIRGEVNGNGYAFFPVNGGAALNGFEPPGDLFRTCHESSSASAWTQPKPTLRPITLTRPKPINGAVNEPEVHSLSGHVRSGKRAKPRFQWAEFKARLHKPENRQAAGTNCNGTNTTGWSLGQRQDHIGNGRSKRY
jgi:hypothetical protein